MQHIGKQKQIGTKTNLAQMFMVLSIRANYILDHVFYSNVIFFLNLSMGIITGCNMQFGDSL